MSDVAINPPARSRQGLVSDFTAGLTTGVAVIPTALPLPKLPDPSLWPVLLVDALAIAVIALVQGAGVSKAYPNSDYPEPSRDFIGQGAANIGAGLLQGMPVGGSVSTTALNVSTTRGARRLINQSGGLRVVSTNGALSWNNKINPARRISNDP